MLVPDVKSTDVDVVLGIATQWRSQNGQRRSQADIDSSLVEERSAWDSAEQQVAHSGDGERSDR